VTDEPVTQPDGPPPDPDALGLIPPAEQLDAAHGLDAIDLIGGASIPTEAQP